MNRFPFIYVPTYLLPISCYLDYYIFTVILGIRRYKSNVVLFKIVWSSLVSLLFRISFRMNLLPTEVLLDFDFDFVKSVDQYREN